MDLKLLKKLAEGKELTPPERLKLAEQRPLPTPKDWFVLYLVWVTRFTFDLDKPVSPGRLVFLRHHLSALVFTDLVRKLSAGYSEGVGESEPVTMWDIKRLLNRRNTLRKRRIEAAEHERKAAAMAAQRAVAKQ